MLSAVNDNTNNETVDIKSEEKKVINNKNPNINIITNNNVTNYPSSNNLMVEYIDNENKFTLYSLHNNNKSLIGSFTGKHVLKYIITKFCKFNNISVDTLNDVDISMSEPIIEHYICKFENNGIFLLTHIQSSFMGNIEMILNLIKGISNYESSMDKSDKSYDIVHQFLYLLYNHSLKLIASISEMIKNDNTKEDLKKSLTKYSVAIIFKINNNIKNDLDNKKKHIKILQDDMVRLKNIKEGLTNKINNIEQEILHQNSNIDIIISEISKLNKTHVHTGGNHHIDNNSDKEDDKEDDSDDEENDDSSDKLNIEYSEYDKNDDI